jgi:DNA repair exonuclease SbcCD ATPase subunit
MADQKKERGRVNFKSIEDLNREIERLQKQVDSGTMKIVDEKKTLSDITNLHRQKKTFATFATAQKQIDEIKGQIAELKKTMDDPESKAMSGRYDEIRKELDELKKLSDDAFKNLNTLRDERTKASTEQSDLYNKIKDIKDKYYQAKRDHRHWEDEQKRVRREKYQAEKTAYESGKRREVAQRKLEDASASAYQEEIIIAENLIRHFDPTAIAPKVETGPSKFAAVASRTVDDASFKGMRVVKKDDDEENYFIGSSKKKKAKKAPGAPGTTAEPTKFNLSVDVIEQLAKIGIDPPVSQSHVPITITKIKEKVEFWKKDQDRKTKEVRLYFPV